MTRSGYWWGWGVIAVAVSSYLGAALTTETVGSKALFLPGRTTAGHYQIELACASCHTPFQGVTSDACVNCHGEELRAVDDSHPKSKFTDPRNAELITRLDATDCVTCHKEHKPEMTRPMGVTLPDDYCFTCHSDIGQERPSHADLGFETCASAGCHHYHDNTALYEDFLVAHAGDPDLLPHGAVPPRGLLPRLRRRGRASPATLPSLPADAPDAMRVEPSLVAEWERTAHARAGVNCSGCHTTDQASNAWIDRPDERRCATCHDDEVQGFLGGRHGMRRAIGLPPMRPALARQPMKAEARDHEVSCMSCHSAHGFDTRQAAADACLVCHDDRHSQAYTASPHYRTWKREIEGRAAPGSGVSCATCHLPRQARRENGAEVVLVQHNQSANLRPSDKMIRSVCLACHGLQFSIDALADPALAASNFRGRPRRSVNSIDMAMRRTNAAN